MQFGDAVKSEEHSTDSKQGAAKMPSREPKPAISYEHRTAAPRTWVSLHAKCIVVDERRALVGSANFTDRGQTRNLEVGALVEDPTFSKHLLVHRRAMTDVDLLVRYRG